MRFFLKLWLPRLGLLWLLMSHCSGVVAASLSPVTFVEAKDSETLDTVRLTQARLTVWYGARRETIEFDSPPEEGFSLRHPTGKWTEAYLHVMADGYTFQGAHWNPAAVPAHLTYLLEHAIKISGRVLDREGRILRGAKVIIRRLTKGEPGYAVQELAPSVVHVETTDKRGVWSCDHVPEYLEGISFEVQSEGSSPAHYITSVLRNAPSGTQRVRADDLLSGRATFLVEKGLIFTGRVVDPRGRPLVGVKVTGGTYPIWTNSEGEFTLRNQTRRTLAVLLEADGFHSVVSHLDAGQSGRSERFVLQPVLPTMIRFEDSLGRPVEGVFIWNRDWKSGRVRGWRWYSDLQGRVVWNGCPVDRVEFSAFHPDYRLKKQVVLAPGRTNQIILEPVPVRRLRVVDDSSGESISQLEVLLGHAHEQTMHWVSSHELRSADGRYQIPMRVGGADRLIMLNAAGYSRLVISSFGGELSLDEEREVRLSRLENLRGKVVDWEGWPVAGAQVGYAGSAASFQLGMSRLLATPGVVLAETAPDGSFSLQLSQAPGHLAAVHQRGFGIVSGTGFDANGDLRLEPWGRVQVKSNTRIGNDSVEVVALRSFPSSPLRLHPNAFDRIVGAVQEVLFDSVPPGVYLIGRTKAGEFSHPKMVTCHPGQLSMVSFLDQQCSVSGSFRLPKDMGSETIGHVHGWLTRLPAESELSPDVPSYARDFLKESGFRYILEMGENRSFSADDLPPGEYTLELRFHGEPHSEGVESYQPLLTRTFILESEMTLDLGVLVPEFE